MNSNSSTTIGVVVSSLHETYESVVWSGVRDSAMRRGINLLTFVATSIDQESNLDFHYHTISDIIHSSHVDGVVLSLGSIADLTDPGFVEVYSRTFQPLPTIGVSFQADCIPCVVADNHTGMEAMVTHLIKEHGRQHIAFVKGPKGHPEAEARFEAYQSALAKSSFTVQDDLILPGNFCRKSGVAAIETLLTHKTAFDAVVCVNDETALGVTEALERNHFHVPTQLSVTGFDDAEEATLSSPSLTSVHQPFYQIGATAVQLLAGTIFNGKPTPNSISLPASPVFRRSCGCFPICIRETGGLGSIPAQHTTSDVVNRIITRLGFHLRTAFSSTPTELPWTVLFEEIVENFDADIKNSSKATTFLAMVDSLMFQFGNYPYVTDMMQGFLFEISNHMTGTIFEQQHLTNGNAILQKAHVLLREHQLKIEKREAVRKENELHQLRETSQRIISIYDRSRLWSTILRDLPKLGIRRFAFAAYPTSPTSNQDVWRMPKEVNVLLAFDKDNGATINADSPQTMRTADIIPSIFRHSPPWHYIFMPVAFAKEQLGYLLIGHELNHPLPMYEELRLHLASSYKSALLMESLKHKSMKDELTSLYNRRGFIALAEQLTQTALSHDGRLMVFYVDVDGLKSINDIQGHEVGDEAIVGAAQVLEQTFRNQDIIGRLGGDEFAIVITVDDTFNPNKIIRQRLEFNIEAFNQHKPRSFKLSMSVGSALFRPSDGTRFESILNDADMRMMCNKRERKKMRM